MDIVNIHEHASGYGLYGFVTIMLAANHIQEFIHDADGTVVAETKLVSAMRGETRCPI